MPSRSAPTRWPILPLLLLGSLAFAAAIWLVDHRAVSPYSGQALACLMGIFGLTYTCAMLLWMRWRDHHAAAHAPHAHGLPTYTDPLYQGTVYGLTQGAVYEVQQPFKDHYQNVFQPGERLRFKERHFLPYHGGHTLVFEERSIYLQEDQNRDILDAFSDYVALVPAVRPG